MDGDDRTQRSEFAALACPKALISWRPHREIGDAASVALTMGQTAELTMGAECSALEMQ